MSQLNNQLSDTTSERHSVVDMLLNFIRQEFLAVSARESLSPQSDLLSEGIIDSLGIMRLVAFIESSFSITVPPEDVTIENFINVAAIGDYISRPRLEEPRCQT